MSKVKSIALKVNEKNMSNMESCWIEGNNNLIKSNNCIIIGDKNTVIGHGNKIHGVENLCVGDKNQSFGRKNELIGFQVIAHKEKIIPKHISPVTEENISSDLIERLKLKRVYEHPNPNHIHPSILPSAPAILKMPLVPPVPVLPPKNINQGRPPMNDDYTMSILFGGIPDAQGMIPK